MSRGAAISSAEVSREQGFEVFTIRSDAVEVSVVPELGARIISLKDRRTGREWMWHPDGEARLFKNRLGDDFSLSTLTGADECLPTIAPCKWQGRELPDHGEVWSSAWKVDTVAWRDGALKTSIALAVSPFEFDRVIKVSGNAVRLNYTLKNKNSLDERFLWALHPLLRLEPGDHFHLPATTRALLGAKAWPDAVGTSVPAGGCAKIFAVGVKEGFALVHNPGTRDRLTFEWNPSENNTLGLWLTRGGWHGHHHFAIEPTNGSPDPLARAVEQNHCGTVRPFGTVTWRVCLRLGE